MVASPILQFFSALFLKGRLCTVLTTSHISLHQKHLYLCNRNWHRLKGVKTLTQVFFWVNLTFFVFFLSVSIMMDSKQFTKIYPSSSDFII